MLEQLSDMMLAEFKSVALFAQVFDVLPIDVNALQSSGIGKTLGKMRKSEPKALQAPAAKLVAKWKKAVEQGKEAPDDGSKRVRLSLRLAAVGLPDQKLWANVFACLMELQNAFGYSQCCSSDYLQSVRIKRALIGPLTSSNVRKDRRPAACKVCGHNGDVDYPNNLNVASSSMQSWQQEKPTSTMLSLKQLDAQKSFTAFTKYTEHRA